MKILFIGGTGSISTSCSHMLASKGYQLTLITRGNLIKRLPENVNHIQADFNHRNNNLYKFCSNKYWDCVINWNIYNKEQAIRDIDIFKQNTKKYIYISSTAIYGDVLHPINEETKIYNTIWDYANFKLQAEYAFKNAWKYEKFPCLILRPGHTYCDFTIPTNIQGLGYGLLKQIYNQEKVLIHDSGQSLWTLTHSDDFAKILSEIIESDNVLGEVFNIVSSEYHTWDKIYDIYGELLNKKLCKIYIPSSFIYEFDKDIGTPIIADKQKNRVFDNTKIFNFLPNFKGFISTNEGLNRSVQWAKENQSTIYYNLNIKRKIKEVIDQYKKNKNKNK